MITLPLILPIVWGCLAAYGLWYVAAAKHAVPLNLDEAKILWKIHKQNTNCTFRKWQPTTQRNGKVTGFKCDCGYKYIQKRHILSRAPITNPTTQRIHITSTPSKNMFLAQDQSKALTRASSKS